MKKLPKMKVLSVKTVFWIDIAVDLFYMYLTFPSVLSYLNIYSY